MRFLFPYMIVFIFAVCGVESLLSRRWNDAVYSFAAAVLNYAVYFKPFQ